MATKRKPKIVELKIGAPEWLCTFGDMMSLLLTFFILLFSVSEQKSQKVYEVYTSFQRYFDIDPKVAKRIGYFHKKVTDSGILGFLESGARPPSKQGQGGRTNAYLRENLEQVDKFVSHVKEQNNHMVVVPGPVLFEPGKAAIRPEAVPSILKLASWLRGANQDLKIVGHASTLPLGSDSDAQDHLTLGYLRAMAVARFLAGDQGDLAGMARQSQEPSVRVLATKVRNISMSRITVASMGNFAPEPSRRELWIDPQKDDRVEVMLLPERRR